MAHENTKRLRDRYHGALLGSAAGDALGTTLEFRSPDDADYHRRDFWTIWQALSMAWTAYQLAG